MSGIYIHIPFCKQACHYCDFHFSTSLKKKTELVQAIVKEIELRKQEFENQLVETIYFGGGTPSLLSIDELLLIIETIFKHYRVSDNPEITLEANPDDLSKNLIIQLSKTPVNRLSIGIQSFFEADLKLMNRAQNAEEAKACLQEATKYFDNISVDLIYGIPGLTYENWIKNIETVLSYQIPHISSYALTVEPKTALDTFIKKGIIQNVDDELAQEQFHLLIEKLEASGFVHYELSNFGKPAYFSKNNSAYWQGKSYLGIGPSAHSFNGNQRSWNVRNNSKYIKALQENVLPLEIETLSITDKYNEYVMTGLRTIWGVSIKKVELDFGKQYKNYLLEQANLHLKNDFLYLNDDKLLITKKGKFLSDGIASDLFKINL
ncbi:MAG: radical SAM family heme chaperone HemW [Flavobacteriales bacterium]|nr:radical SAM family heme chaperone HemW [Flavobacteriia bacterium]NCP06743.1 radical SAM family heme chaperone HemW [Flavobacteriales bacterium]PIV94970.1 MAG: coproporphyrinogen III oxidase [Flavobacteriaceae bacterium CG17_big_fil_post_rev_8_21_14_2_50_33_15]PIY12296.1 MAG: coproporphyrinogen III oxidase [Flavobacteriaceae bacterium CG_4_10_14_3_um_filter_33_47]PJB19522.1 MAG: coproporphyrinogen III oxidase [Flavobacteriaceae bacterium CG_4_9_14_3_um_filter_33_16]